MCAALFKPFPFSFFPPPLSRSQQHRNLPKPCWSQEGSTCPKRAHTALNLFHPLFFTRPSSPFSKALRLTPRPRLPRVRHAPPSFAPMNLLCAWKIRSNAFRQLRLVVQTVLLSKPAPPEPISWFATPKSSLQKEAHFQRQRWQRLSRVRNAPTSIASLHRTRAFQIKRAWPKLREVVQPVPLSKRAPQQRNS